MATSMYKAGYRYYVYVGPGAISYFRTLSEAKEYQQQMGGEIGEVI